MSIYTNTFNKIPKKLRSFRAFFILLLVCAVLFFGFRGGQDKSQFKMATVERKSIESKTTASGSIKSEQQAPLKFLVSGKLAWLNIKEGDKVQKWQGLAGIENEKYSAALRQAKQNFNQAAAVLSQVQDDLRKFSPPENFDQKIKRTNAETAQNLAYDSIRAAEEDLAHTTLTAPFSGTITSLKVTNGETVTTGVAIGEIADLSQKRFIAEVDETEVGNVKMGQNAKIKLDAFEGETLDTILTKISQSSTVTSTGATAYLLTFEIPNDEKFRLGMNGEAEVIVDRAENVLAIPSDAIVDDKYVWVKTGDKLEKNEVELGIESDTESEVRSGISENSQILTAGFDQIGKKNLFQKLLRI